LRPLAAGVALILSTTTPAAIGAVTHLVTTCNDQNPVNDCSVSDDGTLRRAFVCAGNGDTIDLTQLQCSKITLSSQLFNPTAGNVTLNGPGRKNLSIEAGGRFRVIAHAGSGTDTLIINDLTIAYGLNTTSSVGGGCIYSQANILLTSSTVTHCAALSSGYTTGGAMLANGRITAVDSNISNNRASSSGSSSAGGGIKAYAVHLVDSTVSHNSATDGGGVFARAFESESSTISYNYAVTRGGVFAGKALLMVNSTISNNNANHYDGGVRAEGTAAIYNSTIASNFAAYGTAGLEARSLYLQSSIIAKNIDTISLTASDLGSQLSGIGVRFTGVHNLIMSHSSGITIPDDTIVADPKLGGLQNNGGPTSTLALLPGSPAIDHGANFTQQPFDQRGVPRVIGKSADIGAFESDFLFNDSFDP
jgi:hypothetical protein